MTSQQGLLEHLRDLDQRATQGRWEWLWDDDLNCWRLSPGVLLADTRNGTPGGDEIDRANAALITLLRNSVPAILEMVEASQGLLRELEWVNEQLDLMPDDYAEAQARLSRALATINKEPSDGRPKQ